MPPEIDHGTPFSANSDDESSDSTIEQSPASEAGPRLADPAMLPSTPTVAAVDPPQPLAESGESTAAHPIGLDPASQFVASEDEAGLADRAPVEPLERSELPWARQRNSPAMRAVLGKVDEFVRRGFELGERGALFSARAEFIGALRLLSEALDADMQSELHSRALSAGLTALRESESFIVRRGSDKGDLDVSFLVKSHSTPVLKDDSLGKMTPLAALQRYYTYAQEQLAAAAGREMSGSMALYGLGRITTVSRASGKATQMETVARAMVWQQAALLADPLNFRAANELGVLVAETGDLQRAKQLLLQSLASSNQPTTWKNLAAVHQDLGERELATQASSQATALAAKQLPGTIRPAVRWVDPATFANTAPPHDSQARASVAAGAPSQPSAAPAPPQKRTAAWLPWKSSSRR
jgi:tetratricopeptide (TPR) repeat protein